MGVDCDLFISTSVLQDDKRDRCWSLSPQSIQQLWLSALMLSSAFAPYTAHFVLMQAQNSSCAQLSLLAF